MKIKPIYKIFPIIKAMTNDIQTLKQVTQENNFKKNLVLNDFDKDLLINRYSI